MWGHHEGGESWIQDDGKGREKKKEKKSSGVPVS